MPAAEHDTDSHPSAGLHEAGARKLRDLIWPGRHSVLLSMRRAELIVARVRLVAWVVAAVMPLFVIADILLLPWQLYEPLVAGRVVTCVAFVAMALGFRHRTSPAAAQWALGCLFMIPTIFFLFAEYVLGDVVVLSFATGLAATYSLFPFVVIAGLALFPITAAEGLIVAAPLVLAKFAGLAIKGTMTDWSLFFSTLWLLGLVGGVAIMAAASQLHLMIQLLGTTARDRLTGSFTRRVGEELLAIAFGQATREDKPLALVLLDLDGFKQVNDRFGHDAGDQALRAVGHTLSLGLRRGDFVVRWGGDEFLMVLPNTHAQNAEMVVRRVCGRGLGRRPDGGPQTASLGISEYRVDRIVDWEELVTRADSRAGVAKREGKNRVVSCDDKVPEQALAA